MDVQQKIEQAQKDKSTKLDLSELALTTLPASIGRLTHLKELNLSKNNLQTLPAEIGKLKELTSLNLWSNSLNDLPKELAQLKKLTNLDLEDNHLAELPTVLFSLSTLEVLDLEHNSIVEIPERIGQLKKLQQLDLSRNKLQRLTDRVDELKALRTLNLKGNLLRELPSGVCKLEHLRSLIINGNELDPVLVEAAIDGREFIVEYFQRKYILDKIAFAKSNDLIKLDLNGKGITEIPKSLFELSKLKILSLENNNIWELPDDITKLSSLEVLDLSRNELVVSPPILKKLPHLKVIELEGNPIGGSGKYPKVIMRRQEVSKRIQQARKNHSEILDLSDCGLTSIPGQVLELSDLHTLILGRKYKKDESVKHRNYITELPGNIGKLNHLRHLDLSGNAFSSFSEEIVALTQLQTLNLSQNSFRKLPSVLMRLAFNLKTIVLAHNQISQLPLQFSALKNLELLDLSYNNFVDFPEPASRLPLLRKLVLHHNKIENFPEEIGEMPLLQYLDLSYNEINKIGKSFAGLRNLEKINLSYNQITELPGNIHLLRFELRDLNVSHNRIKQLPVGLRQLIKLKNLDASHNKLTELTSDIFELKQLKRLHLNHNSIAKLPKEIVNLKSLEDLNLTFNQFNKSLVRPIKKGLEGIREWFNYQVAIGKIKEVNANKGTTLDISNLNLRSIPKSVFDLKKLKVLKVGQLYKTNDDVSQQNKITHLPQKITQLADLEELYVGGNAIKEIPQEISELKKLRVLDVSDNNLKSLPSSIGRMMALEYLNVNYNQLRNIPHEFTFLANLGEVHWNLNAFEEPFKSVLELDFRSTRYWLAERLVQERIATAQKSKATTLDLSNCQLKEIPEEVFKIRSLKILDISCNQITEISGEIHRLNQLSQLNISNNKIDKLPFELGRISALKELKFENNELSQLPVAVRNQGLVSIQQWLSQQSINDNVHTILKDTASKEKPLYKKGIVICQVCHGKKTLTGIDAFLDVQFYRHACYGCNGMGKIEYDSEHVHLILNNSANYLKKIQEQLSNILQQKKTFEQSMLFSNSLNSSTVSRQMQRSFHNILKRYNAQLKILVKRHSFYQEVQKRLHSVLYNHYLLYCALDEFRKLDNLETGLSLNFEEKAGLQKDIIQEVTSLNTFVKKSQSLDIPADFVDIVNDLAIRYQALA